MIGGLQDKNELTYVVYGWQAEGTVAVGDQGERVKGFDVEELGDRQVYLDREGGPLAGGR